MGLIKDFRSWGRRQVAIAKGATGESAGVRIKAGAKALGAAVGVGAAGATLITQAIAAATGGAISLGAASTGALRTAQVVSTNILGGAKRLVYGKETTLARAALGTAGILGAAGVLSTRAGREKPAKAAAAIYSAGKSIGESDTSGSTAGTLLAGAAGVGLGVAGAELYDYFTKDESGATTPTQPSLESTGQTSPIQSVPSPKTGTYRTSYGGYRRRKKQEPMRISQKVNVVVSNIANKRYINRTILAR